MNPIDPQNDFLSPYIHNTIEVEQEFIKLSNGWEFIRKHEVVGLRWVQYMTDQNELAWSLKIFFTDAPHNIVYGADAAAVMKAFGLPSEPRFEAAAEYVNSPVCHCPGACRMHRPIREQYVEPEVYGPLAPVCSCPYGNREHMPANPSCPVYSHRYKPDYKGAIELLVAVIKQCVLAWAHDDTKIRFQMLELD